MDAIARAISRRETGKAERRRRIVAAAAALVRETGFEGVSMVQVADRAGVAPSTVYNLLQTKAGIFRQVFDLDLEDYRALVAAAPAKDALERLFAAIDLAADLYRRDPDFYRAMARVARHRGEDGLGLAIREPRTAFWQGEIAAVIAEGHLSREASPDVLGVAVAQFMGGAFMDWAAGVISAGRLAKEAAYGFALALLPYATDAAAITLRARLAGLEAVLASDRQRTVE